MKLTQQTTHRSECLTDWGKQSLPVNFMPGYVIDDGVFMSHKISMKIMF